jgi:phage terminase small subunit
LTKVKKLTPKEAKFVREYLIDLNATAAAKRAGYSSKTAYRIGFENLRKPHIQRDLEIARKELEEKTNITPEWVLTSLVSVANRCLQQEQVLDRDGNPTGEFQFAYAGANKALELVGRHLGMFNDKLLIRKITDPDDLTEEEAIAVARKLKERLECK